MSKHDSIVPYPLICSSLRGGKVELIKAHHRAEKLYILVGLGCFRIHISSGRLNNHSMSQGKLRVRSRYKLLSSCRVWLMQGTLLLQLLPLPWECFEWCAVHHLLRKKAQVIAKKGIASFIAVIGGLHLQRTISYQAMCMSPLRMRVTCADWKEGGGLEGYESQCYSQWVVKCSLLGGLWSRKSAFLKRTPTWSKSSVRVAFLYCSL